jgi:GDP-D-mannose 3',5'-epimerase
MHNSATINLNVLDACYKLSIKRIFYSSSARMYPADNQKDSDAPNCEESTAYPAAPDSEYDWEKLFRERLYLTYGRCYGMEVRVARYHNIFGPEGTQTGGREKAPAALCRKIAMAPDGGTVEIWGDGRQTRSFLYIDECDEGTIRLTRSAFSEPTNIGLPI